MSGFERAIVIGGSIAGLSCARALADRFAHVLVLEQDLRHDEPTPRKRVPQGPHVHAVLEIAVRTLEQWFPGIKRELVADGARVVDFLKAFAVYQYGGWKARKDSGIETIICTRPRLEAHVRRRAEALGNVEIIYERKATALRVQGERVTGVQVEHEGQTSMLDADLVIDCAGRSSHAPQWLEQLGFGRVDEERVEIDLAYSSRLFELPAEFDGDFHWLSVYGRYPSTRGGFLYAVDDKQWLVSLIGYFGDHAPLDDEGFLAFARSLPVPDLYQAIAHAKPTTPITRFKIPASRWLHYERLRRFPDGLLVLGDSVCVLNPLYGQGMTVAIQCAHALSERVAALPSGAEPLRGFGKSMQREIAGIVAMPWMLSTTLDLKYPQAKGKRPLGIAVLQAVFADLIDLTSLDERAWRIFAEVLHMRRGPTGLAHPHVLLPLLAYAAKSRFVPLERRVNTGPRPKAPA